MWRKYDWKMKKLKKVWGKIKLLETSAVGIPVYPYAHKSYSLVKALRETEQEEKLNLEESPMEEGETESEEKSEEKSEEESKEETPESEVSEPEKPEEKSEESEESKESKESDDVDKGLSKKDMMDMMTKGFQAAIKASSTPRGLIDNENSMEKMKGILKEKSLGELAIMNGMFKAPDMYGRVI